MAEEEKQSQGESVVYASPLKRIWAWVGVVYMVIIVLLMTYMFAFGAYLQGIAPLMLIPAIGGVGASVVCLWVTGPKQENRSAAQLALMIALVAVCAALIVYNLIVGIPALAANFGR